MPKKIILIEDNKSTRLILERGMRNEFPFATILVAGTMMEARNTFHERDIDLVIMDGSIEEKHDSLELLEELELMYEYKGPIISIAGTEMDCEMMRHAGATHTLAKPFLSSELVTLIRLILPDA